MIELTVKKSGLVMVKTDDPDRMEELRILAEDDAFVDSMTDDMGDSIVSTIPVEYIHFSMLSSI